MTIDHYIALLTDQGFTNIVVHRLDPKDKDPSHITATIYGEVNLWIQGLYRETERYYSRSSNAMRERPRKGHYGYSEASAECRSVQVLYNIRGADELATVAADIRTEMLRLLEQLPPVLEVAARIKAETSDA